MKILIVEDEVDLNHIIKKVLVKEGYTADTCYDGEEAYDYIKSTEYDAIILDVMLPKLDGFGLAERIRRENNKTPILFLTARDAVADRVKGLDIGGDDYLIKPFSFDELMARIRLITRRAAGNINNIYQIADLVIDCTTHIVERNGSVIDLSSKEFAMLEYMIMNKGIVLSREKIETHVWNYDYEGGSNMVDVYIRYLRKKIDDDYDNKLIHTIRGYGYVLREQ
jgi:Response regulators consisting of a CheY-like receiver domain and a winged-helix DNA-binding domain